MPPELSGAPVDRIRAAFPSLSSRTIYLENAGGSQLPRVVGDAIHDYMLGSYVQLGAGYPLSRKCTQLVADAHAFVGELMNARDGHVVLGPSSSALLRMLADCYAERVRPGDEIVLAQNGHEANLGPWKRLERQGAVLRWWEFDPQQQDCPLESLIPLLNQRTVLLAFPHVSNLLGSIANLPEITRLAHAVGARVVVDGVAFAPHRAIDTAAWGVDWYVYSTYKVYGPHMAALYGRAEAFAELHGPNHFFVPEDDVGYKFELGGANHEGCAGLLALGDYLSLVADREGSACDRSTIERAFAHMEALERPLLARFLEYLRSKASVQIVGARKTDASRVGTVSFVHESKSSAEITATIDASEVAIRHGHMYAYHLCEALGLPPEDGVVRVSFVHYNTVEEIERIIELLDRVL